jgi:hypothetical protein
MTTLDTLHRRAFIRAVISTVAFVVCMIALLVTSAPADAQTVTYVNGVQRVSGITNVSAPAAAVTSASAYIAQWQKENDGCRGAQIEPSKNPACKRAGQIANKLYAQGWSLANHDVWYSHAQYDDFVEVLAQSQMDIPAALATQSVYTMIPTAYQRLHARMPDDVMFAIWNNNEQAFRQIAPGGSAIMQQMLQQVSRYHGGHDPRFYIDGQ